MVCWDVSWMATFVAMTLVGLDCDERPEALLF